MRTPIGVIIGLVLFALACRDLTDPPLPSGAVRFTPPPVYARWWAITEACSGRTSALADVTWYVVPFVSNIERGGRWVRGYWSAASNQIVLAGTVQLDGPTVRHEMLHALVQRAGHSEEMFIRRCGGVVACEGCVKGADDGSGPPDPASVAVLSDFLEVAVDIAPSDPSAPGGEGFVTITVTARNPADHPIVVIRETNGMLTFFHEVDGHGEDRVRGLPAVSYPALTRFAAGETKRHVFDIPLLEDGYGPGLGRGTYVIHAGYGRKVMARSLVVH